MPRLTPAERDQIEQFLADAISNYPVPKEHYAYVSTLLTHIQADFSQMLMEPPLDEDKELCAEYRRVAGARPLPAESSFQSSYFNIVVEVLRRQNPFEQTLEERALAILHALPQRPADTPVVGSQLEPVAEEWLVDIPRERSRTRGCGWSPKAGITIRASEPEESA